MKLETNNSACVNTLPQTVAPAACRPLWEHPALAELTGGPLRPGGIELTLSAFANLSLPPCARVLDVGCGNGTTCHQLATMLGFSMTGMDMAHAQALKTHQKQQSSLQASANNLPFADNVFDAVVCECVLSLTPSIQHTCAELFRVLKPHGYLILSDIYQKKGSTPANPPHATSAANGSNVNRCAPQKESPGGCAEAAKPLPEIQQTVASAQFTILSTALHDKALKELTAQLVLAGVLSTPFSPSRCDAQTSSLPFNATGNEQAHPSDGNSATIQKQAACDNGTRLCQHAAPHGTHLKPQNPKTIVPQAMSMLGYYQIVAQRPSVQWINAYANPTGTANVYR